MTALKTPPKSTIQSIQTLLSEGYGSGFTIFKELVQNADDVGATRLVLAGHDGFPEADNLLLRVPGLFIANNGPVSSEDWEGLQLAAGGSKGGDTQAVGRFGLGQKALYHLCDAYPVFARLDGSPTHTTMVLNPYEDIETADNAREWGTLSERDADLLAAWADRSGMGGGLVLRIPLRTDSLRPGPDPRMCLTRSSWTPSSALKDIIQGEQLLATIACLRHLVRVEIDCPGEPLWQAEVKPDFIRLAGPGDTAQQALRATFGGTFNHNGNEAEVFGAQRNAASGEAAALQSRSDWPTAWTLTGLDKAKATPHGAAILCRHRADSGSKGKLRIWHAVYLPLGDPARDQVILGEAELNGKENFELVVHGDFFVSSNRSSILREDGNKGQDSAKCSWNKALEREATLPCVLDAVAGAINALPDDPARYDLVQALNATDWWKANSRDICGGRAVVRLLDQKADQWSIQQADKLRPIPRSEATRPRRLREAWKGFAAWSEANEFVLTQGTVLGELQPEWSDAELAELIAGMAPSALTSNSAAQTLAAILDVHCQSHRPIARNALAEAFRTAMRTKAKMAPMAHIKALSRHLPPEQVFILPKSVTDVDLLAHMAAHSTMLCMRPDWIDGDWPHLGVSSWHKLSLERTVELLVALEPMLARQGRIKDQTISLIGHVLDKGAKLADLERDTRVSTLCVLPIVRARDHADVIVSPKQATELMRERLLFHHGPTSQIDKLANAVVEPAIYVLRQNMNLEPPVGSAIASPNRPSDKAEIVSKATQFGSLAARIALFGELGKLLPATSLRRLISGEAGLRDDAKLARMTGLPPSLMPLLSKLIRSDSGIVVLEPEISGKLSQDEAEKAALIDLSLDWLGTELARRRDVVEPLTDEQAMALLAANLPDEALQPLALHRTQGEAGLYRADMLLRGNLNDVPPTMRSLVRIVDPWPNAKAALRQRDLIRDWTPQRQITLALESDQPHRFETEILDALSKNLNLETALKVELRDREWLTVDGDQVAPQAILDLLPCALTSWQGDLLGTQPVLLESLSPHTRAALVRHDLVKGRFDAYRSILSRFTAKGFAALVVDPAEQRADLAVLAAANCDLDDPIWPIMASSLRAFDSDEEFRALLANLSFTKPDTDAAIDQLNLFAKLADRSDRVGDAARRLWRVAFQGRTEDLRSATGFFPADVLVESETGGFARADDLALDPAGVQLQDSLASSWRFDLPKEHASAATAKSLASVSIADQAPELFAPFQKFHELHSAVQMVLAMLGRDQTIRRVAAKFTGNPGFDDICADLDNVSNRLHGLCDPLPAHMQQMKLVVIPLKNGQALVLSSAGTPMMARAEDDGALLYGCTKGDTPHSWQLSMATVEPRDLEHATRLLRDAVSKLAVPIGMRLAHQSNAVLALFDRYCASDQATLDELISDIKDGLVERIKKLSRGTYLKQALSKFDVERKRGRHEADDAAARQRAKDSLWEAISSEEAATELLCAVRDKMHKRNYAPERTLFELFQNAVDAAHQKGEASDFRVEAVRDETGAIRTLRIVHWGRPINVAAGPKTPTRFERDLDNMLDLDSSEKEGQDHGKHGLGFKTCHMLSDDTRVASGRLRFRIKGGMLPHPWENGRNLQQNYNTPDAQATIVELPIAPGREVDASRAWDEFARVAPFLPAVAPDIAEIILVDGPEARSGKAQTTVISPTIALVRYGGDQQALRLDLGEDHDLYIRLHNGLPTPFPKGWSRLWNLAPLDGEELNVSWLINGKFEMDQGRRGLHGQAESKAKVMLQRGGPFGDRLVELFNKWDTIAAAAALPTGGRDSFFAQLIALMTSDTRDQLASKLHGFKDPVSKHVAPRGLANLMSQCAVVALPSGEVVCAPEVEGVYSHSLTEPEVRQKVESWSLPATKLVNIVDPQWGLRLEDLGFPTPNPIDLGTLAKRLFSSQQIDADRASGLGEVFNASARDSWHVDERKVVEAALRTVTLQAQSGDYRAANEVWIPHDPRDNELGNIERMRASFMPLKARLHSAYQGQAIEFVQLARAAAGYNRYLELEHLKTAYLDDDRCRAALVYLAANPDAITELNWLGDVAALYALPAHKSITRQELGILEACLRNYPTDGQDNGWDQPATYRSTEDILFDVADWWNSNREELTSKHDVQVYGDLDALCGPAALKSHDDAAWFTILSLGSFQTLGRITPQQSRSFVIGGVREGWWHELAAVDQSDRDLRPYVDRLLAWSDIGAKEDFLIWRRCLGDMCLIARNLAAYREILTALPRMIEQCDGRVALSGLLRPSTSQIIGRMGIDAAPLARSLGMGANWIVRELARRGFYEPDEAALVQPFAWSARLRIRSFVEMIGLIGQGELEASVDHGRLIHDAVCDAMATELPFGSYGDLPLELLNTRKRGVGWLPERSAILNGDWRRND